MVSFEKRDWVRQAPLIVAAIEELGPATRIFGRTWFVCSSCPAEEAARSIRRVMDADDGLFVVDLESRIATLINVEPVSVNFLRKHWRCGQQPTPLPVEHCQ
jgi:hypothetical protein